MKIIIAPDSFKGSLTAQEAAAAMERGVRAICPDAEIDSIPMADGGEGTLEALVAATKGMLVHVDTADPLGRPVTGQYGVLGDGNTAVIEMAKVSGLLLLTKQERNPLLTTTYGTGQLIRHALEFGYRKLIIGIGGSATNDCGAGVAQALGVHFFDQNHAEILGKMSGDRLGKVGSIDISNLHPGIKQSHVTVACDVKNPLLGKQGCAHIYSPQKGATPEIVERLEKNMASFIDVAENAIHRSVRHVPGAGAAGGLGAGLLLFLDAELKPGVDLVMSASDFTKRIQDADLILTGEGKIDAQTAFGKTIAGIASLAKIRKIPVIAFGGLVEAVDMLTEIGIKKVIPIRPDCMSVEKAMTQAPDLLENTVERVMRNNEFE